MRVNIYAEEITDRVEIVEKVIDGHTFTAVRLYLELPVTIQEGYFKGENLRGPFTHRPGDDDSAAVTFWGKRDLRKVFLKAVRLIDEHYGEPDSVLAALETLLAREKENREDFVDRNTLEDANGLPDLATLDEDAAAVVNEYDVVIAQVEAAIAKAKGGTQ